MVAGDRISGGVEGVAEVTLTVGAAESQYVMKLYNFFRSGTSHRLRIALHLNGLATQ